MSGGTPADAAERRRLIREVVDRDRGSLAGVLTATPNLRAKFFANPTKTVGSNLPPTKYWDYGDGVYPLWQWIKRYRWRRRVRACLAQAILEEIASQIKDNKLSSTVNTDAVFEDFFAPIVRVSQRSFTSVFALSWAAFAAGLVLIGFGVYIAVHPPSSGNSTVVATVFGGSGAISALGAVFAMATRGIRDAALDHARLRAVLTALATQLGQLRAIAERPVEDLGKAIDLKPVEEINSDITRAMESALKMIPSPSEAHAEAEALKIAGTSPRANAAIGKSPVKRRRSTKGQAAGAEQPGPTAST
jgi:hypothetical protein